MNKEHRRVVADAVKSGAEVLKEDQGNAETWDQVKHVRHMVNIKSKQEKCARGAVAECEEHLRHLYKHVQRHFDAPVSIRGIAKCP
jgi:hypothetical protein